ncbi:MAG: hypothetical protein Q9217_000164 [Psora testacea]
MARPKKEPEKQKDSTLPQHVSVEEFIRTRDAVVTGLSTLQSAVSDLSRAYISNTNAVLGRGTATSINQLTFGDQLVGENGFFSARGPTPAPTTEALPETKKRKRAPHDKNAPKRALTPFFLFLQTARPKIAEEMGPGHTAKEVQDEGGRRWREMPDSEKEKWAEQYGINFARYKELMKAYKAKQPLPEISDAQAKQFYEQNKKSGKIPNPAQLETVHAPEVDSDTSDDSSSDEETPEPVKAPSPAPITKKQKVSKDAKRKAAAAEPDPVLDPALRSPEKKKGAKKSAKALGETAEIKKWIGEAASSPPKSEKQKKKKRKSGVADS